MKSAFSAYSESTPSDDTKFISHFKHPSSHSTNSEYIGRDNDNAKNTTTAIVRPKSAKSAKIPSSTTDEDHYGIPARVLSFSKSNIVPIPIKTPTTYEDDDVIDESNKLNIQTKVTFETSSKNSSFNTKCKI